MTSRSRSPHKIRDIERTVLPNGVRVVTERMPHVRSVSVGVWIGTGSREESREETGISHFIEHMLFKGTKNRSAEQIARSVDSIGGGLDAFTSKELVSYNVKVLDEHLPHAFGIVSDLVRNPLFEKSDIEKEKGVILEELKMDVDNPEYLIHEIFASNFWKGHSLGRPILGTRQTIRSFDRDSVERYYRRYYTPKNILITAAGSLTHKKLVQLAEDHFGELKGRPLPKADGRPQAACAAGVSREELARTSAPVFRCSVDRDAASRALRLLHSERDSGRRDELALVPEHPREAGAGVHGLLGADHVSRRRLHDGVRRDVAEVGRQGDRFHRA